MKIEVCFGSSCHVKGSPQIFQMLQDEIKKNHLEDKVSLGGTLCMGHCKEPGANLMIDGTVFTGLTADTFDAFFDEHVRKPLLG
ncbi:MAG: (2Fe-2S) ferredoxin domain-containing protein [Sphaerochaetaceae bacterium]|jgi:NADH:ubiquinone oxidoreductase subunit E|nr:(2Fe-2S) ferredoxin domain-containing protein [Spirochaetaceae bacterium]MDY6343490.1 (2Fe-2S) ferredoxin domain-containing protein [Sphaerochaetaceae bacterium]